MLSTSRRGNTSRGPVGLAILLLIGILLTSYGYFQPNQIVLYGGLLVVIAGVLCGVVRIITRGDG